MKTLMILAAALVLAGCGGTKSKPAAPPKPAPQITAKQAGYDCVMSQVRDSGSDPSTAVSDCTEVMGTKWGFGADYYEGQNGAMQAMQCIFKFGTDGC